MEGLGLDADKEREKGAVQTMQHNAIQSDHFSSPNTLTGMNHVLTGSEQKEDGRQSQSRRNLELDLKRVEEEDQRRIARDKADKLVIDAEKFRAEVVAPKGKVPSEISDDIRIKRLLDNDDDFFPCDLPC